MNKIKPKVKPGANTKQSPFEHLFRDGKSNNDESQTAGELIKVWQGEVDALLGQKFATQEEAVSAVVEGVIGKLQVPAVESTSVRHYLIRLFMEDDDLLSYLDKLLKIDK